MRFEGVNNKKLINVAHFYFFRLKGKVCEIFDAEHKTATSYTSPQNMQLANIVEITGFLKTRDLFPFNVINLKRLPNS